MAKTRGLLKQEVIAKLDALPDDALVEVANFVDYLRFKQERRSPEEPPYRPVALGGLWKGIEITDEDIADARRAMWNHSADDSR